MFEQTLGEVVLSPLPECIIGMDAVSDWRTLALSNVIVKQKACKFALLPILIGHAKWEPIKLPKPTQVVNLKKYGIAILVVKKTKRLPF